MFYKSLFLTMVLIVTFIGCQQSDNSAHIKALEDQIQTLNARVDTLESKVTEHNHNWHVQCHRLKNLNVSIVTNPRSLLYDRTLTDTGL